MLGVCAHAIFIVSRPCEAKGAHGETDPEADAQMEEEPDIVADEDGLGEIEDVVAYIKGVTAEANLKIEHIKMEHDGKIELMGLSRN